MVNWKYMKHLNIIIATLLLLAPALAVNAQEKEDAFLIWSCVKIDKSFGKENKWNLGLVTEYRHKMHEGVSAADLYFVRPSASYKVLPWMKLQYQVDLYTSFSGFSIGSLPEITFTHKVSDFTLSFRQRSLTIWNVDAGTNSTVLRSRAKVEYRIPKTPLGLHLSTEPYWCEFKQSSFAWFQRLRTHTGLSLRVTDNLTFIADYGWMAYFNHNGRYNRRTYDDHVLYLTLAVKL